MGESLYLPPRAQASTNRCIPSCGASIQAARCGDDFPAGARTFGPTLLRAYFGLFALLWGVLGCGGVSILPPPGSGSSSQTLVSLSCSQSSVIAGGNDACTVALSGAAGSSGLGVSLTSSSGVVNVPGSVTVPTGSTSAGFSVAVSAVSSPQTVTLTANSGGVTKTFILNVGAAAPALQLSTTSLNFGSVTLNTASAPQSITLTSSGSAPVTISAATLTGAGFSLSGTNFPVTLNPGQAATLSVVFDPTVAGSATGSITVQDSASPSNAVIALSGTGQTAPGVLSGLSCTQASITGSGNDLCTVSLSAGAASGGLTVALSSSSTSVAVPTSATVPAGASSVGFTATVSAVSTAQSVTLTAVAGGVTKTFVLNMGAAAPVLTVATTNVPFGNVNLNTTVTQSVLLTSSGTSVVTISAGAVTGAGFTMSGLSFPLTLSPGQTATLDIQFDPTTVGAATGAVTLTSNASPSTVVINLSGTGQTVSHTVSLSWNAPVGSTDPVAGYNIYRATGSSTSYQLLNTSVNTSTSYTDTGVQSGSSYTYYVESIDAQDNPSAPSNTATVSIP